MPRPLTIDEEIRINQFSQGLHTLPEMLDWFRQYDEAGQRELLGGLLYLFFQSHPKIADIEAAAKSVGKAKSPCAVMLTNPRKPYRQFGGDVCRLPVPELPATFSILLATLSLADNRRKKEELYCNHWWHQDLSDEAFLDKLRRQRGRWP